MIIRGMRWGYDGGGVACGPVEGHTVVEVCVTNNERHNFFVLISRMMEFEHVYISPVPLFDLLIESNHYNVDSEAEYEKILDNSIEDYDYEISNESEEMEKSEFAKAIHLARLAMEQYYFESDPETDYESAKAFIKNYIGKDVNDMDLPELEFDDDDDEKDYEE